MKRTEIAGYACPVCNTANPVSVKYCSQCGHWLLDTVLEPIPLNKKEFKKRTKNFGNIFYKLGIAQIWIALILTSELLMKSQTWFDILVIAYFIFTAVTNFKAGKLTHKNQSQLSNDKH
jgi:predicted nucleic acid-binding Zn ribbon protein